MALGAVLAPKTAARRGAAMTRGEHLQWAKDRALEYADQGDVANAIGSLRSDLGKHAETAQSARIVDELMMPLVLAGHLSTPRELRKFIEGFG
jgi:hypothetical protein